MILLFLVLSVVSAVDVEAIVKGAVLWAWPEDIVISSPDPPLPPPLPPAPIPVEPAPPVNVSVLDELQSKLFEKYPRSHIAMIGAWDVAVVCWVWSITGVIATVINLYINTEASVPDAPQQQRVYVGIMERIGVTVWVALKFIKTI